MFLKDGLDGCYDLFLISDITGTSPNLLIASFLLKALDCLIDVFDLATDDVDGCSMKQELLRDFIADSCGSSTNKD